MYLTYGPLESLEFPEDSYYLSTGSRLALRLCTQPEMYDDVITWSSSDATVLRVDGSGIVTAYANGTATITARCGDIIDSVTISVVDDILVSAAQCVRELSLGCDASKLAAAKLMTERLDVCTVEGADTVSDLIKRIIAYTIEGDREALNRAIDASGIDDTLCRTAAVCCWAYGEQQVCEGVISFVGDCTLARYNESAEQGRFPSVYAASGSLTYPFDRVMGVFASDDYTLINFEGTLTDFSSHHEKNFYFRGEPEYASMLPAASIEGANLANNHSLDYYQVGYDDTTNYLTQAGVDVVDADRPLSVQIRENGISVVFLAANIGGEEYTERLHDSIVNKIRQYKDDNTVVIVNLHWGVEGSGTPSGWQREAAYELIDAGAALIVGHHPHVLQGIEIYNGKYIAYSLGNFSFGGNRSVNLPETCILRARLGWTEGAAAVTGVSVIPCYTTSTGTSENNYQPMLCFGKQGDSVYSTLIRRSAAISGVDEIYRPDV